MNTLDASTACVTVKASAGPWLLDRIKAGLLGMAFAVLTLVGCGGGGDGAITNLPVTPRVAAVSGPDAFALFPNPLLDTSLSTTMTDPTRCPDLNMLVSCFLQSNDMSYAVAYYAAIDPGNNKDTFAKWKTANGFDNGPTTGVGPLGEVTATLGDAHDLGYGRRMTGRQNADGTLAFYVENYNVDVGGGYGDIWLNVEAAARRDPHWFIGINGIEFSPEPTGTKPFAKFYTFDPLTGARLNEVNLDSRGLKAMPGLCVNCHGGRGDPLTPSGLFARVENTVASLDSATLRGDLSAKLQPFKVDEFKFFNGVVNGVDYSRAGQEAKFKKLNEMVLCSYPKARSVDPDEADCKSATAGANRPVAGRHDWQGPIAEILTKAYGNTAPGDGLPNTNYADTFVPDSWILAGKQSLYNHAVKPYCITCHVLRGISHQSDINFLNYTTFATYAPYIKKHVFDRGNMPLARLVYENFWADANDAPKLLADWLAETAQGSLSVTRDANNKPVRPGLPVADPGPDRVVPPNTNIALSAGQSQFATSFQWAFSSNPGSAATLDGVATSTAVRPVFKALADGTYTITLTAFNSNGDSTSRDLRVVVVTGTADPAALRFSAVSSILQAKCASCHQPGGNPLPPLYYLDPGYDRSGTGLASTNTNWLHAEVKGRVNFTDVAASSLLRKPAGHHHGGNAIAGFDDDLAPGAVGRADYDLVLNWILSGAPR